MNDFIDAVSATHFNSNISNSDTSNDTASTSTSLTSLLSTGAGMPRDAHMMRVFSSVCDGLYLGSAYGVDDIVFHANVRLLLRVNAGGREPRYRILYRPFKSDGLARCSDGAVDEALFYREFAASVGFVADKNRSGDTSRNQQQQQIKSWKGTPIFVRSIAAVDEASFDISVFFEETSCLIEAVLQDRLRAVERGEEAAITAPHNGDDDDDENDDKEKLQGDHVKSTTALYDDDAQKAHAEVERIVADSLAADAKKRQATTTTAAASAFASASGAGQTTTRTFRPGVHMLAPLDTHLPSAAAAAAAPAASSKALSRTPNGPSNRHSYGPPPGDNHWAPCVAVHCQAGVSRSASIVAAYILRKTRHANVRDVLLRMKLKRQVVEPNSGFISQLVRYRATEFLPLQRPDEFATQLVERFQHNEAVAILQRVLFSLVTARRPDLDFFRIFAIFAEGAARKGSTVVKTASPLPMLVDALREVFDDGIDLDSPFVLTTWSHVAAQRFATHPAEFVAAFPANRSTTTTAASTFPRFTFADSAARHAIHSILPAMALDGGGNNNAASSQEEQEEEDERRREERRNVLLGRVVDVRERITRALKLCRLNGTASTSSLAFAVQDEQVMNDNKASLVTRLLKPISRCFRTSFAFMPLLVANNACFFAEVADFIQDNTANEEDALRVMQGLLRAPIAGGSSHMDHATVPLLTGLMHQAEAPRPTVAAAVSPGKSGGGTPKIPGPSAMHVVRFENDDVQQDKGDNDDVQKQQDHQQHHQHHHDPELLMFVKLARCKALVGGTGENNAEANDESGRHISSAFPAAVAECSKSIYECIFGASSAATITSATATTDFDEQLEHERLSILTEKLVGGLISVALTVSPQLAQPQHMVRQRSHDDPANVLPLPRIPAGVSTVLCCIFEAQPALAEALSSSSSASQGNIAVAAVLRNEVNWWLDFLQLRFDAAHGLVHLDV